MKKKLGILTQPLHDNYGGLLQAFALKTILESLAFDVEIINRRKPRHSLKYKVARYIHLLMGKKVPYILTSSEKSIISKNTIYFRDKYIKDITKPIYSNAELKKSISKYDGFVVGSDQVWKPSYSPDIGNYYLSFLNNSNTINLVYAASFGVDTWDYNAKQTKECVDSVYKFKAVSVREDSGIDICDKNLCIKAVHVLDPTMLLNKESYIQLIEDEKEAKYDTDSLVYYILDQTPQKLEKIKEIGLHYQIEPKAITQKKKITKENLKEIDDCVYPTVTSWLNGFYQSKFVITDSFHGTVFALLFNKPFLVFANPSRGNARFTSLLKLFKLEDRLIANAEAFSADFVSNLKDINWNSVNEILYRERDFSMSFLKDNLKN